MSKVWINGTFDVLHIGHIRMLRHAASLGELYVGIDTDRRVKEKKGDSRPINPQESRKEFLEAIIGVQKVFIFDSDEELSFFIKSVSPDYHVIGEEYKTKKIIGKEFSKEMVFFSLVENFSTSEILSKI